MDYLRHGAQSHLPIQAEKKKQNFQSPAISKLSEIKFNWKYDFFSLNYINDP